jgi:hypothetical protein
MNEFKLPIKKMWQQGSQSIVDGNAVQLPHETGAVVPIPYAPAAVGLLYIAEPNTPGASAWISTGTQSVSDWKQIC